MAMTRCASLQSSYRRAQSSGAKTRVRHVAARRRLARRSRRRRNPGSCSGTGPGRPRRGGCCPRWRRAASARPRARPPPAARAARPASAVSPSSCAAARQRPWPSDGGLARRTSRTAPGLSSTTPIPTSGRAGYSRLLMRLLSADGTTRHIRRINRLSLRKATSGGFMLLHPPTCWDRCWPPPRCCARARARPSRARSRSATSSPAAPLEQGDFRDRLARKFAAEVQQADQRRAGVRDLSRLVADEDGGAVLGAAAAARSTSRVYPLAYAGGEVPEVNIGLMPCLVTTYEQGMAWKKRQDRPGADGAARQARRQDHHLGLAGRRHRHRARRRWCVPDDVKGLKIRGGSREMDLMLKAGRRHHQLGAAQRDLRRHADRLARRGGDLVHQPDLVPPARRSARRSPPGKSGSFWFMFEPLLMSKQIYDSLPADQQKAIDAGRRRAGAVRAARPPRPTTTSWPRSTRRPASTVRDMDPAAIAKWKAAGRGARRGRTSPTATPPAPPC